MPHKNTIRHYAEDGIYHIYNRGVEKRDIYLDEQDYAVFLHLLKYYLSPLDPKDIHPLIQFQNFSVKKTYPLANLEHKVELAAFCLMPNHFHLLARQTTKDGITQLLRKVSTTYVMYFNKRYNRVGYLFQGKYKAITVDSESYLLHLSRYIHLNPAGLKGTDPFNYPYSSYKYFIGQAHATWVKPKTVLDCFKASNNLNTDLYKLYGNFMQNNAQDSKEMIGNLSLD
jgi:putative transposase